MRLLTPLVAQLIGVVLMAALPSRAVPIHIFNASFEDEVLPLSATSFAIPGWTPTCLAVFPCSGPLTVHPTALQFDGSGSPTDPAIGIPDGVNVAITTSALAFGGGSYFQGLHQTLPDVTLTPGFTYTLTAWAATPFGASAGTASIHLLAGSSIVGSSAPSSGQFNQMVLSYTASASDPGIGQNLTIGLEPVGGGALPPSSATVAWDLVELDVTHSVPEPSTFLTVGSVLLFAGSLLKRRGRRRSGSSRVSKQAAKTAA